MSQMVTVTLKPEDAHLVAILLRDTQDYCNNVVKTSPQSKQQDEFRRRWVRLQQIKEQFCQ